MKSKILILTEPGDTHAYAVALALERKGAQAVLWHTTDFPTKATESIAFTKEGMRLALKGPGLDLADFDFGVVWHRRPAFVLDEANLHPSDRKFAELECYIFRRALLNLIAPRAFWVNPSDAATCAGRKPVQHAAAIAVGLETPDTIYTNDPDEIREFLGLHGGEIVYKPFRAVTWKDDQTYWIPYTSPLTSSQLVPDNLLRATPGIYQALVPKAYELRVTVMGRRVLAAKVHSQATETGRLDWRKSYHELTMEPYDLPSTIEDRCVSLLERLGLVFGCFDFIVTPEGSYVFLEVNEMGQFLFVEHYTGLPLLDEFSEFLIEADPAFKGRTGELQINLGEMEPVAAEMARYFTQFHVQRPDGAIWEKP